jgi:hypothetical protein
LCSLILNKIKKMKKIYILVVGLLLTCGAFAQCSGLYFSEYAEGSSNNKYLEIYNASGAEVNMSDYAVVRLNGGSTSPDTFVMNGTLGAYEVYTIANASADATILAVADTTGSATFYNGDDALTLVNVATMTAIDIIGVPGTDPGSEWAVGSGSTKEHTLVRMSSVTAGQTDWAVGATEWNVYPQNTWDYAGSHASICAEFPTAGAPTPTADAADVISLFSNAYTDVTVDTWRTGWSNATLTDIQLGTDDVKRYTSLDFVGIEAVGANSIDASGMDHISFDAWTPNATTYRIKLVDFGADNAFGGGDDSEHEVVINSPGLSSWNTHQIALSDMTGLSATSNISQIIFSALPTAGATLYVDNIYFYQTPEPAPMTAAAAPTADAVDVISLFSNTYTDVTVDTWRTGWSNATLEDIQVAGDDVKKYSALDFVGIETVGANSIDASGMDYFTFDAWTPNATTYRVKLVDFGADNAFGGGDDTEHEIAFANPTQETWTNHTINLSDFTGLTGKSNISQIIFSALPTAGTTLYIDNVYFSRDPVYTVSTIADVIMLDADLAPTNEDARYEVTGVVYGGDLDGNAGLSFTIIDATAGINVFNFTDVSDYVVTEGDEITVRGKIDFYRGLLEIVPDSIKVNSQGNALKAPTAVAAPSEATESDFIVLEKVWITNDTTTIWPDNGNVELTNENADTFQIRIDRDIPGIVGEPVAFDTMTITGIGGQFDFSAPYDEGYQIFPRGLGDIAEWVATSEVKFSVDMKRHKASGATWGTVNLNGTFNNWNGSDIVMTDDDMDDVYEVTVTVPNGDIEWKYTLDGWNAQEEFAGGESCTKTTGEFTNRYIEVTADTEIAVVCYNKCITCEEAEASVNDIALNQVTVYPNPTQGNLTVESNEAWTSYEVYSVLGLKVAEGQMVNNTLSVQSLTEGTYLLKLKSDTNAGAARFVINR